MSSVTRRRAGLLLMTAPILAIALSPVAAQEAEAQPVEITDSTLYVASATAVLPRTLTADVPPTAACIVVPEICPPELDPIRDPARELVGDVASSDVPTLVHPVPPDHVAVSYLTGTPRYQSAILFEAPAPPPGEEVQSFDLVLAQAEPSYDMDSPAFRRMVLGLFVTIDNEDPVPFVESVVDALSNEEPVDLTRKIGIEACPLTAPFEPGGAPEGTSDRDMPRDETGEPAIDCVLGAIGAFDEPSGTWTFDLQFAARAWAAGELANHGVLLRPIGALNLAYGDPDPTTSAQIVLDLSSAALAVSSAPPPPAPGPAPAPPSLSGGTGFDVGDQVPLGLPPVAAPGPAPQPEQPSVTPPTANPPSAAVPIRTVIEQPWWMWLAIPAFLAGILLALSGFVAPATAVAVGEGGAMSHLLARRRVTSGA
ncbi:MAG: hypothetical protein R3249_06070 [Nitriliruptorales bacterium]|nr:hypothetical protein [Nitriliruptorales bacterium]